MTKRMLIDAAHPEETRVVVVNNGQLEDFEFESSTKKQLKGNIYLAKVTRVEPSLQAAFVDYGGQRHGFLAFSEIHPDYFQVPQADRKVLDQAEREAAAAAGRQRRGGGGRGRRVGGGRHRPGGGGRRGLRRAGPTALAAAARLQDPGGHQAPSDPARAGGQGGAGHQGGGAHDVSVAGRPLQRADAEHRPRRRHLAQDRQSRGPLETEGDRPGAGRARGHGPDHPDRRPGAQQAGDPPRLRVLAASVERHPRTDPPVDRALHHPRGGCPGQTRDPRPVCTGHRRGAGRGRGGLSRGPQGHGHADAVAHPPGQALQGRRAAVPSVRRRGTPRCHAQSGGRPRVRRLDRDPRDRGADRDRRQLRPVDARAQHRGDRAQDQPRGGRGGRAPAATARHRRAGGDRFHRYGRTRAINASSSASCASSSRSIGRGCSLGGSARSVCWSCLDSAYGPASRS